MNNTTKRYLVSSLVTFVAGFAIAVIPSLNDELTLEAIKEGALFGIVTVGVRAGAKALLEYFVAWHSGKA